MKKIIAKYTFGIILFVCRKCGSMFESDEYQINPVVQARGLKAAILRETCPTDASHIVTVTVPWEAGWEESNEN